MRSPFCQLFPFLLLFLQLMLTGCQGPSEKDNMGEVSAALRRTLLAKSVYEWSNEEKVIGFRNIDQLWNTRNIAADSTATALPGNEKVALLEVAFACQDSTWSLESYIEHNDIMGLLVIKNDTVVLERYQQGNTPASKWISFSATKSVVSLLVGAALKDGYIKSLNDPISDYLPTLAGSAYEDVSMLQAMQMASGVQWNEDYNNPTSDIRKFITLQRPTEMLKYLKGLPRVAPPGRTFNYNTAETRLVGLALRAAIGEDLSSYLSRKIWKPFGMISEANWWLLSKNGPESGGCCISATLRDYGRIGLFAIEEYNAPLSSPTVLPEGWIEATTKGSPAADYYGALWWPEHSGRTPNAFAAYGVFGQMIWIDPAENLVVVTQSAWPEAQGEGANNYYEYSHAFVRVATELLKDKD